MTKARIRHIRETAAKAPGKPFTDAHGAMFEELLSFVERWQSLTRRGEDPTAPTIETKPALVVLPPAAKTKAKKGEPDPRIKLFIDGWYDAFKSFYGEAYKVQGGKDAMAAKRLLKMADVDTLLDTAWDAWHNADKFNCKQAVTISGFDSRYNDIKIELKTLANGGRPVNMQPAECRL